MLPSWGKKQAFALLIIIMDGSYSKSFCKTKTRCASTHHSCRYRYIYTRRPTHKLWPPEWSQDCLGKGLSREESRLLFTMFALKVLMLRSMKLLRKRTSCWSFDWHSVQDVFKSQSYPRDCLPEIQCKTAGVCCYSGCLHSRCWCCVEWNCCVKGCRIGVLIGTVSKMFLRPRVTHEIAYQKFSARRPVVDD